MANNDTAASASMEAVHVLYVTLFRKFKTDNILFLSAMGDTGW